MTTDIFVLKLIYLNEANNSFENEIVIDSLQESISDPKVTLLKDGAALISWTQNQFSSPIDTTAHSLKEILGAQDVYVALYDPYTQTVTTPQSMTGGTNRAEGKATITMNKDSSGFITWVVGDLNTQLYSIYFATISDANGSVQIGAPTLLSDAGTSSDRNVKVAFTDSVNAIAVWVHDEDGLDSTLDQSIVYKKWNATSSSWDANQSTLEAINPNKKIEDLSVDFTDDYGAVAYTSTVYDFATETFSKKIEADAWNSSIDVFEATPFEDSDSNYYFQNPRISISNNGIATLIYQANALYDDTLNPQKSYFYLLVKDLNQNGSTWKEIDANGSIADSSAYAWDLDASFAGGNNLFVVTQEADDITGHAPLHPSNGVRFGDLKLDLVLRAVNFNNNLDVVDEAEPEGSVINAIKTLANYNAYKIENPYPNPTNDKINIPVILDKSGIIQVDITSVTGQVVTSLPQNNFSSGIHTLTLDMSSFSSGMYIVRIVIGGNTFYKRIINLSPEK